MMLRRLSFTAALLAFAATAIAAPMSGKVAAVRKQDVKVVVTGKLAEWAKKGTAVKFLGIKGTITSVAGDTLTIASPKAATAKVGDAVTFDKARATGAGC